MVMVVVVVVVVGFTETPPLSQENEAPWQKVNKFS